MKKQAIIFAR